MTHKELALFIILMFILFFVIINTQEAVNEPYYDILDKFDPLVYKYGESNVGSTNFTDKNVNTLFSAHPNRLVCSHEQDNLMKHAVLHPSGNIMHTSYNKPNNCKQVDCPKKHHDITPKDIDHYNPYPLRKDKLACWNCFY